VGGPSGEPGSLNRRLPERATRQMPRSMGKSPAVRRSSVQHHWAYAIAQTPIKKTMRRSALLNVGGGPVFISTREERADISLSRSFNPPGPREAFYGEVEHFSRAWSRSGTAWRLRIDRFERIPVVVFPAPVAARGASDEAGGRGPLAEPPAGGEAASLAQRGATCWPYTSAPIRHFVSCSMTSRHADTSIPLRDGTGRP